MNVQLPNIFRPFCFLLLIFLLPGCSQLNHHEETKVNFNMNLPRTALEDFENVDITVELHGDYEASATQSLNQSENAEISFEEIPLGAKVYAYVEIYTFVSPKEIEKDEEIIEEKKEDKIEENEEKKVEEEQTKEDEQKETSEEEKKSDTVNEVGDEKSEEEVKEELEPEITDKEPEKVKYLLYSGQSEMIEIIEGRNNLSVKLEKLFEDKDEEKIDEKKEPEKEQKEEKKEDEKDPKEEKNPEKDEKDPEEKQEEEPAEPGDLTIEVILPDDETVNDISVTRPDGSNTFTAEEGYATYTWKIDGEVVSTEGNVYTVDTTDLIPGVHYDLTLLATKEENGQTIYRSYNAKICVE